MKKDRDIEFYKSSYESSREKLVLNRKDHYEEINKLKKSLENLHRQRDEQILQLRQQISSMQKEMDNKEE